MAGSYNSDDLGYPMGQKEFLSNLNYYQKHDPRGLLKFETLQKLLSDNPMLKPDWGEQGRLRAEGMRQYKQAADKFVASMDSIPNLERAMAKFSQDFFTKGEKPDNYEPVETEIAVETTDQAFKVYEEHFDKAGGSNKNDD